MDRIKDNLIKADTTLITALSDRINRPPPTCKTCAFWDRQNSDNYDLGLCSKLGGIAFGDKLSISIALDGGQPLSDFTAIRTRKEFGCVFHSSHAALRTL